MSGMQAQSVQELDTHLARVALVSPRARVMWFSKLVQVFHAGLSQGYCVAVQGLSDEYIPNYPQF